MKFSIIVPVYNVEKYVIKCLESIQHQIYENYEVIIVNDGSLDNSEKIIKRFIKNNSKFKYYKKENGGLSDARNYGVQFAVGDYLLFIDSDDYINSELLEKLASILQKKNYDIIRYEAKIVNENGEFLSFPNMPKVTTEDKYSILKAIIEQHCMVEPSWLYAYNLKFWNKHHFQFEIGKIHEDYGLTPIILSKAENLGLTNYAGYNYVQRDNSIMKQVNYDKIKKRVNDTKELFLLHRTNIAPNNKENKLLLGFSAEILIYKVGELYDHDQQEMIQFIKKNNVIDQIYAYNFKRKIKKIYLKFFLKNYIKKLNQEFYKN